MKEEKDDKEKDILRGRGKNKKKWKSKEGKTKIKDGKTITFNLL